MAMKQIIALRGGIKMKFFETIMGRRFFEGQLPNLIKQLTRIADALEESNELKKKEAKDDGNK